MALPQNNVSKRCRQNGKQSGPWSDCSSRSSLIRIHTVCPGLSVQKFRNTAVFQPHHDKTCLCHMQNNKAAAWSLSLLFPTQTLSISAVSSKDMFSHDATRNHFMKATVVRTHLNTFLFSEAPTITIKGWMVHPKKWVLISWNDSPVFWLSKTARIWILCDFFTMSINEH